MKVSVIVGYYNRENVVERTIESLLAQTYADMEIIAFDDCSTDGTGELLASYAERAEASRLRVIRHEANQGFVLGLIKAIESASGEYIAIHGSGDVAAPRRIELQAGKLDEDPGLVAVGSWYENINDSTGSRSLIRARAENATIESLMVSNVFSHGEVMFRRSAYEAAGGYRGEFTFAQDIDLWIRLRKIGRFTTVPEVLYERHILKDGVTHNPAKFARQARFSILARRLAQMSDHETKDTLTTVRTAGPEAVIPLNDPDLQRRYRSGILDIGIWGTPQAAVEVAKTCLTSPVSRAAYVAFFTAYGLPVIGAAMHGVITLLLNARKKIKGMRR